MPDNTPEQIEEVKNKIRRDHDVVTLRITRIKKLIPAEDFYAKAKM
jgi:hypothetical protein